MKPSLKLSAISSRLAHRLPADDSGRSLWIALGSGVLMGLTPAPVNAWFLAWVALAPLWIIVEQGMRVKPERPGVLRYALLWGIGYHGCALWWIMGIHPMTWMGVPWLASLLIAIGCWILITLWGSGVVVVWAVLFRWLSRLFHLTEADRPWEGVRWLRWLLGVALWCGIEKLWSNGPLYWSSLSYTQSPFNLIILHLGQLSGPTAVTAALVACNGLLAKAWMRSAFSSWRPYQAPIALCLLAHSLGLVLFLQPLQDAASSAFSIGLIQGNIPNTIKLYEDGRRRALESYTAGYQTLARQGVDAILTPETALPILWTGPARQASSFYQAVQADGVLVWLGAFGQEGSRLTNSLFTIAGDGQTLNEYRKAKLVPLGEYIPFEKLLGQVINRLSPLEAQLQAGEPHQRIETPFGQAIVGICYESAFPEHFRYQAAAGGAFILTASNDAHYSPAMPAQHHAQDVMRAIETDRWMARATNTGYSAIVDPHGKTLWYSEINTYALHQHQIYARQTQTPYVRWGDWELVGLMGAAFLGASYWRLQDRSLR